MAPWERIERLVTGQSLTLWLLKTISIYWVLGWGHYSSAANPESDASGLLGRDVLHYHHYPGLCLWVRTWYEIALLIFSLRTSLSLLEQRFQESLSLSSCGEWQNRLKKRGTWCFFPPCVRIVLLLPMYSEIGQDEPTGMAEEVEGVLVWDSRRDVLWLVSTNMSIISRWHVLLSLC